MWLEIKKKTLNIIGFIIFTFYSKTEYFVGVVNTQILRNFQKI